MGNVMFMRKGEVHTSPLGGLPLSSLVEGQIVMINENGTLVPFYLAKHNYELGLNGEGRDLFVRTVGYKTNSNTRPWHSSNANAYASSDIDTWLNGNYKALLDESVQEAIGTTKFYYTVGKGSSTKTTLSRSVFLLSVTEMGKSHDYANKEGSALPIASTLMPSGDTVEYWTRTPMHTNNYYAYTIYSGGAAQHECIDKHRARPCFTLPSTMLVNSKPNADGSLNLKV